jgi:hypothetical protein
LSLILLEHTLAKERQFTSRQTGINDYESL